MIASQRFESPPHEYGWIDARAHVLLLSLRVFSKVEILTTVLMFMN